MAEWQRKYLDGEWIGKKYNHLTITGYDRREKKFVCKCDCGKEGKLVKPTFLFSGHVKTCGYGCPIYESKYDGRSKNRTYGIWLGMKRRCYNPDEPSYRLYGNRGIGICEEWLNDYWAFHAWAINNGYADDLTIDRINSDGNYEPSNCRWATYQEQRDNSRNPYTLTERPKYKSAKKYEINGIWKTKPEWCSLYGVSDPFVTYRMKKGMTLKEALETPKTQGKSLGL